MAKKNTIKGLTIEIGGDTTKLGQALQNVEDKSQSLSGELRDINRLLKFDPGNADLLAQKQKVLAEAVENTGKKLETLREAERQVQAQFEKGDATAEQVSAARYRRRRSERCSVKSSPRRRSSRATRTQSERLRRKSKIWAKNPKKRRTPARAWATR